jgi:membrane dipeptidase
MAATTPAPAWRASNPELNSAVVCDALMPWTSQFLPASANLASTLEEFHANGVDHVSLTVAAGTDSTITAMERLGFLTRTIRANADKLILARDAASISAAQATGLMSIGFHFQTTTPFAASLDLVDAFAAAGIDRAILAYNQATLAGDGCHEPRNGGLTAFGRSLVNRMAQAGMTVDLSHCAERTTLDVMAAMTQRPMFSHSNARALFDHERNLSDVQIMECGKHGGFIGLNGVGMFLGAASVDIPGAMAQHAAYIADLAGPECLGLGLDYMYLVGSDYQFFHSSRGKWPRGYPDPPWDFLQASQFGDLVTALEDKGFSAGELRGILGENYLRVISSTNP